MSEKKTLNESYTGGEIIQKSFTGAKTTATVVPAMATNVQPAPAKPAETPAPAPAAQTSKD